jgi:NhaA family Na+:H+ antiporter
VPDAIERLRGYALKLPRLVHLPFHAHRFVRHQALPAVQEFVATESSGGIALFAAALAAVVWANAGSSYEAVWGTRLSLGAGAAEVTMDLRHWVNEGLMAVFFFLIGLEVKREVVRGELQTWKQAALPVIAAAGGMVAPALIYLAFNAGSDSARGWGVPMATDIAFALGVLALLGDRVGLGLKVFLLTLAVVDDIGSIAVIALFYSTSVSFAPLLFGAGVTAVMLVAGVRLRIRSAIPYAALGVGLWIALEEAGVSAAIAGFVAAVMVPSVESEARGTPEGRGGDLERGLHYWVSFGVVPVFALANAGVAISGSSVEAAAGSRVFLGIVIGLLAGKTLGIMATALLAVRLGAASLPEGTGFGRLLGSAIAAGAGMTVSLLVAHRAFDEQHLETAKLAVLVASASAAAVSFLYLRLATAAGPGRA